MTEPDRGESYLEIQMDRATIVLAGLGILACMVVAFLLGSWTATRKAAADKAASAALAAPLGTVGDGGDTDNTGTSDEDVDAQPSFGGRPVSASGAAPLTAVPPPASPASTPAVRADAKPVRGDARLGGSSGITVASDDDDAKAGSATSPSAPATRAAPPKPKPTPTTKSPSTSRTATAAEASPATSTSGGWVVQVAAVKDRPEAEALQKRLEAKGYPVRILEEAGFLKVQVGPYAQKSEAQSAEQRLKRERGLATWVKKA